jgi:two-component system sensor histidine kinase BaeS
MHSQFRSQIAYMRIRLVYTLALWLLIAVGASVLAMGGVTAWNLGQGFSAYLQARDLERLDQFVQIVAEQLGQADGLNAMYGQRLDMPRLLRELQRLDGLPDDLRPAGPPGSRPPPPVPDGRRPPPGMADAFGTRVALFDVNGVLLAGPRFWSDDAAFIERPVRVDGDIVALVRMRAANPIPDENDVRFLRAQYQGIAAVAVALILLALASAWWLARQWAGPLAAVTRATASIAQGQLAVRVPPARNDEIGDVVRNVNLMAESLQRMEGARRRWIADISHELRTPLTALRGEIEALLDEIRPLNREALVSLRGEVLRLGALIDDLHLLAMADLQSLPCHFVDADAADIVQDALPQFEARAAAAGLKLAWATAPSSPLPVCWDPQRIRQLLSNLLENSLRYTDSPGSISLSLQSVGENLRFTIDDSGPGVAADDLVHLFEPLYRADSARNRNTGGSGLGLAICEAIVRAHGGQIAAHSSQLGGLQVEVLLPIEGGKST